MNLEIESSFELRKKLLPVLKLKAKEFRQRGISYISEQDIWNYLVATKWKLAEGLTLSEMTNDILHVEVEKNE